jgi:hypothetical protein
MIDLGGFSVICGCSSREFLLRPIVASIYGNMLVPFIGKSGSSNMPTFGYPELLWVWTLFFSAGV